MFNLILKELTHHIFFFLFCAHSIFQKKIMRLRTADNLDFSSYILHEKGCMYLKSVFLGIQTITITLEIPTFNA
jgi:hypothetical protein